MVLGPKCKLLTLTFDFPISFLTYVDIDIDFASSQTPNRIRTIRIIRILRTKNK